VVIDEDGTATVSWIENKYHVSYQLYYSTSKKKSYKSAGIFETLEGVTPVLSKGKTYYFKVRCVVTINGKNYYSGYSNIISKTSPK
jgi:lactocepin